MLLVATPSGAAGEPSEPVLSGEPGGAGVAGDSSEPVGSEDSEGAGEGTGQSGLGSYTYEYELHAITSERSPAAVQLAVEDPPARSGAASVADLLLSVPAFTVLSDARGERPVLYHGFDGRDLGVEVEGIPLPMPYDGEGRLAELPSSWVSGLVITPDPALADPVMPSLGGTVFVQLRPAGEGPLLEMEGEHGLLHQGRLQGRHSGQVGDVRWLVGAGVDYRDAWPLSQRFEPTTTENGGLRTNSDRRTEDLLVRVRWSPSSALDLSALAGGVDGAWGVPPSTADEDPRRWRFTSWRAGLAGLRLRYRLASHWSLRSQVWTTQYHNQLDSYDDLSFGTQDTPGAFHSTHRDMGFGAWAQADMESVDSPIGSLDTSLRLHFSHFTHQQRPDSGSPITGVKASVASASYRLTLDSDSFWRVLLHLGLAAQIPGDADDPANGAAPSNDDPDLGWSASTVLQLFPHSAWIAEFGAAHTYRFPTLKERFSAVTGSTLAAPDLSMERAWTVRLGASWVAASWLAARLSVFDAEVFDLIEVVAVGEGLQQLQNTGRVRLAGVELGLDLELFSQLKADLGYSYLLASRLGTSASTEQLPYRPRHQAFSSLTYSPLHWLQLGIAARAVGSQEAIDPYHTRTIRLGPFARLDARVGLAPASWLDLWVSASNLLDAAYQTDYGFPEPGRQIFIGVAGRIE
ncbi:MAG: TonB-dependent receptor [Bradymonadales bacterium]|nr:TonB-dependent receptor [Bradymonadales bacterium]